MRGRFFAILLTLTLAFAVLPAYASETKDAAASDPIASYDTKDGLLEFVDYVIKDDVIAIIVDYTNTTSKNVYPERMMDIDLYQDGIKMKWGKAFEVEGTRDGDTQIRPGKTIRYAEFFTLENKMDIEVEFSQAYSWDTIDPLYVMVALDTNKATISGGETKSSSSTQGGLMGAYEKAVEDYMHSYEEAVEDYMETYEKAIDDYANAIDEYANSLDSLFSNLFN